MSCMSHRKMLLTISQKLTSVNLQDLLFVVGSIIPERDAETVERGTELFLHLEQLAYLGPNNYAHLSKWLQQCGRNDLARLLTEANDATELALNTPQLEQSHRFLLIKISDALDSTEVHKLLYLGCSHIPESLAEKIEEGYQLFQELERRDKLGPGNYGYLLECLQQIGRNDLVKLLSQQLVQYAHLPNTPGGLRVSQQTLNLFFHTKRAHYASQMNHLHSLPKKNCSEWMQPLVEIQQAWKMEIPVSWWQPDSGTEGSTDETIRASLQGIFTCANTHMKCMCVFPLTSLEQIRQPFQECHKWYKDFDEMLEKTGWNSEKRQQIRQICDKRMSPHGIVALKACECIREVCNDFLGEPQIQSEIQRVSDDLYILESYYYISWQTICIEQWIANLLHLAETSAVDFSRYRDLLLEFVSENRTGIARVSSILSQIVGQEVMDKIAHILIPPKDSTPLLLENESMWLHEALLWYINLLELVSFATGCPVKPKKVAERYLQWFCSDRIRQDILQKGIKLGRGVASQMHAEVMKVRQTAISLAKSPSHRALIHELLPESCTPHVQQQESMFTCAYR